MIQIGILLGVLAVAIIALRRAARRQRWTAEGLAIGAITDDLRARRALLDLRIDRWEHLSDEQRKRLDRDIAAWLREGEVHLQRAIRWREGRSIDKRLAGAEWNEL